MGSDISVETGAAELANARLGLEANRWFIPSHMVQLNWTSWLGRILGMLMRTLGVCEITLLESKTERVYLDTSLRLCHSDATFFVCQWTDLRNDFGKGPKELVLWLLETAVELADKTLDAFEEECNQKLSKPHSKPLILGEVRKALRGDVSANASRESAVSTGPLSCLAEVNEKSPKARSLLRLQLTMNSKLERLKNGKGTNLPS